MFGIVLFVRKTQLIFHFLQKSQIAQIIIKVSVADVQCITVIYCRLQLYVNNTDLNKSDNFFIEN